VYKYKILANTYIDRINCLVLRTSDSVIEVEKLKSRAGKRNNMNKKPYIN